ncbi:MAG TPA: ABC transporter permease [Candidatus Saccharimonadaceae bacterium]|jgi:putative ABC transport system permease protein|nr:ABC transporter permease [Candidatus Saccharimonadaceae bacterium]
MNLRESTGIALGALRANKLRSFLTLLGTIIGVASVIAVISFVEGLNRFVSDKLINAGSNVFVVDKYGFITSNEAYEEANKRPDIRMEDADALARGVPHARMVVAQTGSVERVRFRARHLDGISIRGRGPGYDVIDDLTIAQGRHITDFDDQHRQSVCVIGPEIADELLPGMDPIGKIIRVGEQSFQVIGVTTVKGKMLGQSQDRFVIVPVRTFLKYQTSQKSVEISIKSADQASLPIAIQEARNVLRGRRHVAPGKPDNFGITTADTWLEFYRTLTGGIFVVMIGVASIALVVGGIVIMNIMLVSVTERTREIGVRKALGARRRDILTQFLVEATTLSLVGGIIGILLGVGLALLVGALSPLPAGVNVFAIVLGIAMSSLVGVFFGSYPAFRAAKLDPIEALRYE